MKMLQLTLLLGLAVLLFSTCRKKEEPIDEEAYREIWVDALAEFNHTHQQIAIQLDKITGGEEYSVVLENVAAEYDALKTKPAIVAIKENGIVEVLTDLSNYMGQSAQHLANDDFPAAAQAMGHFVEKLNDLEYKMKPVRRDSTYNKIEKGWDDIRCVMSYPYNPKVQELLLYMHSTRLNYQESAQIWLNFNTADPDITLLFFHEGAFNPVLYEMAADFSASEIFWNEFVNKGFFVPAVSPVIFQGMTNGFANLHGLYSIPVGIVPLFGISCEDRCTEGATRNRSISELTLVPLGLDPDAYDVADNLASLIDERAGDIVDAHKKIMANIHPVELYVKCKWEVCEKNSCWVFWEETEWVEKESGWIKVDCPVGSPYNTPPTNCWPPASVAIYDAAFLQALYDAASDKCK